MRILRTALSVSALMALGLTAACSTSTPTVPADTPAPADTPVDSTPVESSGEPMDEGEIQKGDGSETIYLVSKGFQHRFWQAVNEGAQQAGEEFGYNVEFVGPENETQVTEQLNQLNTALNSQPAAIGFAALDSGAASPVLDKIQAADIPVIAFDSGVDSDIPLTTVQTDNRAAAAEAAQRMAELVNNEGTVGLVCHDQTSTTGIERCEGFQEWMEANAPEVTVLEPQYAGEVGLAANTAKAMVQANPDMVGIYGTNEAAAIGALQGIQESGKELAIIGFDSGKAQLDAVRSGVEAGAITQSPVKMGYETVRAAVMAINGADLPEVIDSGFAYYDAENMDDEDIKANLYE